MTEHTHDDWFQALHNEAMAALDRGWNVIPISISSKKPLIEWKEYQTKEVTAEMVDDWFEHGAPTKSGTRIKPFNLAVLTGAVSGIVVVDCDNIESVQYAEKHGMKTPYSARTRRGRHFYFAHPGGGQRFGNKVGSNPRDWPSVDGLDFRGDGGYVLMPPSVRLSTETAGLVEFTYHWELPQGVDWDDLDAHVWSGPPTDVSPPNEGEFSFGSLNLTNIKVHNPDDGAPIYDQTKIRVAHLGRKLSDGDGCDALMVSFCGQKVRQGLEPLDLWKQVSDFQEEFFNSAGYTS